MNNRNTKAFAGLLFILPAMGALTFLPAWMLDYWQAWTFLAVFGTSVLAITLYLMEKDPKLLERRTQGGPISELGTIQEVIQTIMAMGFIGILVVSALDHRFAWSLVPQYVPVAGEARFSPIWTFELGSNFGSKR